MTCRGGYLAETSTVGLCLNGISKPPAPNPGVIGTKPITCEYTIFKALFLVEFKSTPTSQTPAGYNDVNPPG